MYNIHVSDVRSFLKCRRLWGWTSPLRMNMEPAKPYTPFYYGRAIHYCIEENVLRDVPFRKALADYIANEREQMSSVMKAWPAEVAELESNIPEIQGVLDHYSQHYALAQGPFDDENITWVQSEVEFNVPLDPENRINLEGRLDGIIQRNDDKTFWIIETKTARSISELVMSIENDMQAGMYLYAARQMNDFPIQGILYNIIKKSLPANPPVLMNGTLSQAKSLKVTQASYLFAIRENHPDWDESTIAEVYGSFLAFLGEKENDFFARVPFRKTGVEISILANEVIQIAREMINPTIPLYATPSYMNCNFCSFRTPCMAMSKGQDIDIILESMYRIKTLSHSLRESKEIESNA